MTGQSERVHFPISLPPSKDWSKRDAQWERRFMTAQGYLWGRMDMGEKRDVNRNFQFCEWYADEYWRFDREERFHMWSLAMCVEAFDQGKPF